ncbi:hypothetical protein, partial [Cronobacter sakazakii]|uniref:hypothetical protein n=2 Tax=Cronobacter sakazakii TaxID=28141 RepID=UPI002116CBD3
RMSYCRFSSDNWRSDVYCYESAQGYITHVASSRIIGDVPAIPFFFDVPPADFFEAVRKQNEFIESAEREPIGLDHDGDMFIDKTPDEMIDRLIYLSGKGYFVPVSAIESLSEEIKEGA